MTEGYSIKLLKQKLEVLTTERNKIREIKPEEISAIESHYHILITDIQRSIEKLTSEEKHTNTPTI